MRRVYFIVMSLCVLVVRPLYAQVSTDTSGFRQGQWGIGFVEGMGATGADALRFSAPTRAWVLNGWGLYDQTIFPGAGTFGADQSTESISLNASVGPRWYQGGRERLVRFIGVGMLGSYGRIHSSQNGTREDNWSVGAYGEIGVQYMFSRHLGVGWRGTLLGGRGEDHTTQGNGVGGTITQQATHYELTLQPVQVIATIYF